MLGGESVQPSADSSEIPPPGPGLHVPPRKVQASGWVAFLAKHNSIVLSGFGGYSAFTSMVNVDTYIVLS